MLESRPDLEPAVALQRALLGLVIDLAETLRARPAARLSLPAQVPRRQAERGVPALAGEPIPLPVAAAEAGAARACATRWREGGPARPPTHIRAHRMRRGMDAGSLLTASLKRDQTAIRTGARHQRAWRPTCSGWSRSSPSARSRTRFSRSLFDQASPTTRRCARHSTAGLTATARSAARGRRWPKSSRRHRVLRCSFCALAWELHDVRAASTAAKTARRS